jgi:hypothetical protein
MKHLAQHHFPKAEMARSAGALRNRNENKSTSAPGFYENGHDVCQKEQNAQRSDLYFMALALRKRNKIQTAAIPSSRREKQS